MMFGIPLHIDFHIQSLGYEFTEAYMPQPSVFWNIQAGFL